MSQTCMVGILRIKKKTMFFKSCINNVNKPREVRNAQVIFLKIFLLYLVKIKLSYWKDYCYWNIFWIIYPIFLYRSNYRCLSCTIKIYLLLVVFDCRFAEGKFYPIVVFLSFFLNQRMTTKQRSLRGFLPICDPQCVTLQRDCKM